MASNRRKRNRRSAGCLFDSTLASPMHRRHDADEEVERHTITFLQGRRERFAADTRHAHLAVRFVRKAVVQIVEQLAVNAHGLHPVQNGVAGSFQHQLGTIRARITSIRAVGASPSRGATSIVSMTSMPETTRPNAVYFPSSDSAGARTMKNELVALTSSAPRAMETIPRSCFVALNSGSSVRT